MPDLNPGTVFAGHRIEGIAGRGGMGTVYRATHLALEHVVALKVISPDLAADDAFRERFRSESRIAVSLRHPNVVPIHHAGEEDGLLFVTMDLIDGPDLRGMLIASGSLTAGRAVPIIAQVASALDVAHSRGLVHRDIKPGNILIERNAGEHAYLTDFGLAKRFDQATEAGALTRTGAFVGTLDYVAPEQIRGDRVDARTDVYALGCVLYEAVAGRAPFADREENVAKIYAHLQDEPPWLPGDGDAEGALDEVIARALAKEPGDRYPSAGDLARAAAAAIEGQEVLRSAERSVATGKAAPATSEPEILETVESEVGGEPESGRGRRTEPEPTQPFVAAPGTTAEHPGPTTQVTEAGEALPPPEGPPSSPTTAGEARQARREPHYGRIGIALGIVAALVAAAIALFGGGGDAGFATPVVDGDPIRVARMPVGIAAGAGDVAVTSRQGRLQLLAGSNGELTDEIDLDGAGEDVTVTGGFAWATVPDDEQVIKAPLDGSAPAKAIDVGAASYGTAADGRSVWIAQPDARQIASIDLADDSVSSPIPIPESKSPAQIAAGEGRLWVVDRDGDQVFSVDLGDPSAAVPFAVGDNPKGVVVADGSVWVANTNDGNVVRLGTDGSEQDTIAVGGEPRLLAFGFGRVWVANGDGSVQAIDPSDDSFQAVEVEGSPEGVAIGSEQVWVTTGTGDSVVRIDPGVE